MGVGWGPFYFTMGESSVELRRLVAAIEHDEATTRKIIHRLQDEI